MKQLGSSDPVFNFAKPNSCPPRHKTGKSLNKVAEGSEISITAEAGLWCRKRGLSEHTEAQPSISVWLPNTDDQHRLRKVTKRKHLKIQMLSIPPEA